MKPNQLFSLSMIVFILVFGCSIPAGVATQTPAPVNNTLPTTHVSPTTVATLTSTLVSSTPIVTPHSLRTSGPYLAYQNQESNQTVINLLDADGMGQSKFFYPSNANLSTINLPLSNTLSPNGKWMAYYSGSAGTCFGEVGPETADLTLNLMSLIDGTVRVVTPLLSKDYPDIFTKAAQQLGQADVTADMLQNAFICGITQSLDWSPDGRYLAFAGQMDGLSSDLYIYDSVSDVIKRLSSGSEEVGWISWSPDGKWILDGSTYSVGEGMQYNIYATSVDGASIKQLSKGTPQIVTSTDWLDEHSYFDSNEDNGPGSYDLKLVDVSTGKTSEIWKGSYSPFAFVPYGNWVTLDANTPTWPDTSSDFQTGIFLVNTTTLKQTRVNSLGSWGCCYPSAFIALGHIQDHLFLVKDHSSQDIHYLSSDGKLTTAGVQAERVSVSPDRLDWIAIETNIQIFSDDGSPIRSVNLPANLDPQGIGLIIWRQDSSGLFFTYKDIQDQNSPLQLYALDLTKGDPAQVNSLSPFVAENFFWVASSR